MKPSLPGDMPQCTLTDSPSTPLVNESGRVCMALPQGDRCHAGGLGGRSNVTALVERSASTTTRHFLAAESLPDGERPDSSSRLQEHWKQMDHFDRKDGDEEPRTQDRISLATWEARALASGSREPIGP
jgi:hypothetical protein